MADLYPHNSQNVAKIIIFINNIAIIWQIYWGNIYLPIPEDWNKNNRE